MADDKPIREAQNALKSRQRSDYPFVLEYRTRWSDNDQYAHLNNTAYYHLFDSIINTFLSTRCSHSPTSSKTIGLVVSSNCVYFAPVSFPAIVDVGLRVKRVGGRSVGYEIAVFERGGRDVRAVGEVVHVFVDREERKGAGGGGMEEGLRRGFEGLMASKGKL